MKLEPRIVPKGKNNVDQEAKYGGDGRGGWGGWGGAECRWASRGGAIGAMPTVRHNCKRGQISISGSHRPIPLNATRAAAAAAAAATPPVSMDFRVNWTVNRITCLINKDEKKRNKRATHRPAAAPLLRSSDQRQPLLSIIVVIFFALRPNEWMKADEILPPLVRQRWRQAWGSFYAGDPYSFFLFAGPKPPPGAW